MEKFSKFELKLISSILIILLLVSGINLATSIRRGRDATRKDDIAAFQKAIEKYKEKYNSFPLSTSDGKAIGCFNDVPIIDRKTGLPLNAIVCDWGKSTFEDIKTMIQDPSAQKGRSYYYTSNGKSYFFYISLEGKDEAEYTQSIINLNLHCGTKICNYGRGS